MFVIHLTVLTNGGSREWPTILAPEISGEDQDEINQLPNKCDNQPDEGKGEKQHHNPSAGLSEIEAMNSKGAKEEGQNGSGYLALWGAKINGWIGTSHLNDDVLAYLARRNNRLGWIG